MENISYKFNDQAMIIEKPIRDMILTYHLLRTGIFGKTRKGIQGPITRQVIIDHMWLVKGKVKDRIDRKYNNIQ